MVLTPHTHTRTSTSTSTSTRARTRTRTHPRACTHAPTHPPTHTHARLHSRARTRAHARTHARHDKCVIYMPNISYHNYVSDIMIWLLCYVRYESPYWRSRAAKIIQDAWRNMKKCIIQANTTQNDHQILRSFIPSISLLSFC